MPITFTKEDYEDVLWPHEASLIINPVIRHKKIWKVLVDGGSSINILYHHTYEKMNLEGEHLEPCTEPPLYGFDNQFVLIEGTITLPLMMGRRQTIENDKMRRTELKGAITP